ncbi:hypothetical protein BCR36DRAFT_580593 [Piromyces finnis]|uniref:Ubiquitin-domain-containing protein n=1 Tax=Piromyces finnis TaxID=1754191 RepID=A0A1Y1VJI2_9FUNG|nr:hypothetical protein BCR36DRAFT_580593 [Piromyces finnis]|eukprot:ORX57181.1 hypothetical protein BCR36DRAFT_580593 [Piromyces finnis]
MSEELTINIKFSNEKKLSVTLNTTDTVLVLKQKITEQLKSTDTPLEPDQQILIYAGRILKNETETIESIKIKNGNTIHMVKAKPKQKPAETTESASAATERAAETTATNTPAPNSTTTTPVSAQPAAPQPSPMSAAAANPFAQLGQAGGNPFAQLGFNSGFAAGMNNQNAGQSPFGGNLPPLDPNMFNEMLNNPAVLNMLSSMFQNPQMMDMLFSSSPQLASFNTPEFRSTMNQMMSNPETLRSILQLSNMYGNMFGSNGAGAANPFAQFQAPATTPASNTASTPTTGTTPAANTAPQMPDMSSLLGMLGGMPGMGAPGATATANDTANQQPPEVRYSTQLAQLQDMGFYDSAQNIRALTISGGRVEAAVEWLLSNPF